MIAQLDCPGLIILPVLALVVLSVAWHFTRSRSLLEQWATENGYRILTSDYRVLKGPLFWTSSRDQTVYRVTVRSREGVVRSGWVRCGSWWFGLFSNKTEVRWDD